ncbi:Abscisic acid 8'-hydroxylase 3 [Nymphaea thermarum]|nr:Abscisic acid 8'-hydroxylase 3 [Nymphaea thermarum]
MSSRRYGDVFRTHVLGYPSVMLAGPDDVKFVLASRSELFKPTYPRSKMTLIGPSALFFHEGDYHMRLRKLVQASLLPDSIRSIVADVEAVAISVLASWSHGNVVHVFSEMKQYTFNVGITSILGILEDSCREELRRNYSIIEKGYNSFPNKFSGTLYSNALMFLLQHARKRLGSILSKLIAERREKGEAKNDRMGNLLRYRSENGEGLSDEEIADNVIGVLFAAQDTTASVLTWLLKYLHDNSQVLESVRAEQMAIHEENDGGQKGVMWGQTKKMPLTSRVRAHNVILETLRKASILSFTFRDAVADVEYKELYITNSEFFPNPQKFDPSIFKVAPRPNTFLPFGTGIHSCPGNEFAKLEMLVLVHHLDK